MEPRNGLRWQRVLPEGLQNCSSLESEPFSHSPMWGFCPSLGLPSLVACHVLHLHS